jgi:hypothetical protein
MDTIHDSFQEASARGITELELALLQRGVDQRLAGIECCSRCHRTPLIGERVFVHDQGDTTLMCELCRSLDADGPCNSRLVHGPAFGHTIRIIDQRAA